MMSFAARPSDNDWSEADPLETQENALAAASEEDEEEGVEAAVGAEEVEKTVPPEEVSEDDLTVDERRELELREKELLQEHEMGLDGLEIEDEEE